MASSIWKTNPTLEALNNFSGDHMGKYLDIEFTAIGDDFLTAKMPVDGRTRQPYGLLHGGASCVLAETIGSVAGFLCVDATQEYVVGLDINANHVRSVKEGFVFGTARPFHVGKTTQVWEIKICDEAGKLVCISRLTVAVKKIEN